jgi:hypothetical protein
LEEPTGWTLYASTTAPARMPLFQGFGVTPTGKCIVSAHTTHPATSVLKPLKSIVGE